MLALKNNYFKLILFLIACIFLFSTLGIELCHNHDDEDFHKDCPACIWQSISIICPFIFILLSLTFLNFNLSFVSVQVFIAKTYQVFHLRSPPVSALIP